MSHDPVLVHHRERHPELFADLIGEPLHVVSRSLADAVTSNQRNLEIYESPTNRKKIAELLRVNTSKSGEAEIEFEGVCGSLEARE